MDAVLRASGDGAVVRSILVLASVVRCRSLASAITPEVPHATLTVRPNPVRGPVEVEVTLPNYQNEQMELVLYDALGRPVHQHRFPAYSYILRFDTSHLAPGVYLLQLRDHQRVIATERVVVME